MKMTVSDTIQSTRCLLICQHLRNKIDGLRPCTREFFSYRNELLLEENSTKTNELLSFEHELSLKIDSLAERMDKIKDDEKKKELVCTRGIFQTTENKLKEVSKQLNRTLGDSKSIGDNERKAQLILHWMVDKFDVDLIRNFLSFETPVVYRETAETKYRNRYNIYSGLQAALKEEKERAIKIVSKEKDLETLRESVNQIERNLEDYKCESLPSILEERVKLYEKKESSVRECSLREKKVKEELENITQAIELEEKKQIGLVSFYKNQISHTKIDLNQNKSAWNTKASLLNDLLNKVTTERDNNLKVLLDLKLSWQQMEDRKQAEIENKVRLKNEFNEKEIQHRAATILQNKIKVMYLSKLKKKKAKGGGKKKAQKGKKKKV